MNNGRAYIVATFMCVWALHTAAVVWVYVFCAAMRGIADEITQQQKTGGGRCRYCFCLC